MDDILARIWADLAARVGGPLTLRLVLQPLVAVTLAVRAGLADARAGRPAYAWAVLHDPAHRLHLIQEGWKATATVFVLAIVMDAVYQFIVLGWFYPGEALIVATLLAFVPYLAVRGPVNLILRGRQARQRRAAGASR